MFCFVLFFASILATTYQQILLVLCPKVTRPLPLPSAALLAELLYPTLPTGLQPGSQSKPNTGSLQEIRTDYCPVPYRSRPKPKLKQAVVLFGLLHSYSFPSLLLLQEYSLRARPPDCQVCFWHITFVPAAPAAWGAHLLDTLKLPLTIFKPFF